MTPEERQMLAGLFDRVQSQADGPRDADAEAFINDAVRRQPYAPYLLAQTVLVQQQGLTAANDRIQELEAQLRGSGGGQRHASGSFLGDLGRSIFGSGQSSQPQPPPQQRYQPPPPNYDQQRYAPAQPGYQQGGPWGQQQAAPMQRGGGGGSSFLTGALGTAAGVAGGVLLADSMKNLFSSHSATAATMAGDATGGAAFNQDLAAQDIVQDQDQDQDDAQDAADDYSSADAGRGDDNSFDV